MLNLKHVSNQQNYRVLTTTERVVRNSLEQIERAQAMTKHHGICNQNISGQNLLVSYI
jgi:hypothetical protein